MVPNNDKKEVDMVPDNDKKKVDMAPKNHENESALQMFYRKRDAIEVAIKAKEFKKQQEQSERYAMECEALREIVQAKFEEALSRLGLNQNEIDNIAEINKTVKLPPSLKNAPDYDQRKRVWDMKTTYISNYDQAIRQAKEELWKFRKSMKNESQHESINSGNTSLSINEQNAMNNNDAINQKVVVWARTTVRAYYPEKMNEASKKQEPGNTSPDSVIKRRF